MNVTKIVDMNEHTIPIPTEIGNNGKQVVRLQLVPDRHQKYANVIQSVAYNNGNPHRGYILPEFLIGMLNIGNFSNIELPLVFYENGKTGPSPIHEILTGEKLSDYELFDFYSSLLGTYKISTPIEHYYLSDGGLFDYSLDGKLNKYLKEIDDNPENGVEGEKYRNEIIWSFIRKETYGIKDSFHNELNNYIEMKKNMGTYKEFKEYSSPEYIETRNTIAKKYIPRFIQILERAIQLVNWEKNNRV